MSAPYASTPEPPYYAVIFPSRMRAKNLDQDYSKTLERMIELAGQQPGYIGLESARDADGFGITLVYYDGREAISNWAANAEHRVAQNKGRAHWYQGYRLKIGPVCRDYKFSVTDAPADKFELIPAEGNASPFADTPKAPYYAVIFTFRNTGVDMDEYFATTDHLLKKARALPGFYGEEVARGEDLAISVSYWKDEATVKAWRDDAEHILARETGREKWYRDVIVRVARIERDTAFDLKHE
jgi:heme-degrading monooxygenase HmoA